MMVCVVDAFFLYRGIRCLAAGMVHSLSVFSQRRRKRTEHVPNVVFTVGGKFVFIQLLSHRRTTDVFSF